MASSSNHEAKREERTRLLAHDRDDHNHEDDDESECELAGVASSAAAASSASLSSSSHTPAASSSTPVAASSPPADVLHLTLVRMSERVTTVDAAPDWTLERLRAYALGTPHDDANKSIVIIYMGRRLSSSALSRTLGELGVRSNTSLHFLEQDRAPPVSYHDDDGASDSDSSRPVPNMSYDPDLSYDALGMGIDPAERNGTLCEFLVGAAMGAMLGVLAIIWLVQPSVSRLCRLGICAGVAFNFFLGASRYFLMPPGTEPFGDTAYGPYGASRPGPTGFSDDAHRGPTLIGAPLPRRDHPDG